MMPGDHVAHGPRSASGGMQVGLLPLAPYFSTPSPEGGTHSIQRGPLKSCALPRTPDYSWCLTHDGQAVPNSYTPGARLGDRE